MEWMFLPLKRYAQFSGRSQRKEYWMWVLFVVLASIVVGILDSILGLDGETALEPGATPNGLMYGMGLMGGVLSTLFALATVIPGIAVSVRRLHDVDRSGWWLMLSFVPYVLGLVLLASGVATGEISGPVIFAGILLLIGGLASIVLLVWACTKGTVGPNRFGPDPMDASEVDLVRTFE